MHPEVIEHVIQKVCLIETEGNFTKGTVIIDWFEKYPKQGHKQIPVKIVTQIKPEMLMELLYESVIN